MANILDDIVIVGITGGIGSGKSTVSDYLISKGFKVIKSDDLGKKLMKDDKDLKNKIIEEFGEESYTSDGELDRKYLASKVFATEESTKKINSIVHPVVIDKIIELLEKYGNAGEELLFVESALMFESGMAEGYDYIITIYADEDKIVERVVKRNNLTPEEVSQRLEKQMSIEQKRKLSDFTLSNNGTEEDLINSVENLLPILQYLPPKDFEIDE